MLRAVSWSVRSYFDRWRNLRRLPADVSGHNFDFDHDHGHNVDQYDRRSDDQHVDDNHDQHDDQRMLIQRRVLHLPLRRWLWNVGAGLLRLPARNGLPDCSSVV